MTIVFNIAAPSSLTIRSEYRNLFDYPLETSNINNRWEFISHELREFNACIIDDNIVFSDQNSLTAFRFKWG